MRTVLCCVQFCVAQIGTVFQKHYVLNSIIALKILKSVLLYVYRAPTEMTILL